jgi:hypothetical protein
VLGRERTGRFLRAGERSVEPLTSDLPAPTATATS